MTIAVEAHELTRRFDTVQALQQLSFEVASGELYGLVGPDGAGKTTAIRALAGLLRPDEGRARVLGYDPLREGRRVRTAMGLMPQEYSLYGDLTVAENLRFFGQLFALSRDVYDERVRRLLAITRLQPFVDRRADALSGGMYKKLALMCALLHEPQVLLLDEPTNGVDPISRRELWDLLYEFVAEGMAVVVSTAYMEEAERCHRVGLLHDGALLAQGAPRDLIDGFEHEVYEVEGGMRGQLHGAIETLSAVLSSSPLGARLRIVVRRGHGAEVSAAVGALDATLKPTAPDFEDLFLAAIAAARVEDA